MSLRRGPVGSLAVFALVSRACGGQAAPATTPLVVEKVNVAYGTIDNAEPFGLDEAKAKIAKPEQFLDITVVRRLDKEGFFDKLKK